MNTLPLIRDLDYISQFVLYISLFFLSVSAYKRTKQKGFVCWGFAAIGYVFHTPMPFQQARGYPRSHGPSGALLDITHCLGVVNNILMLVGIVLIIRGYVRLCNAHSAGGVNSPAIDGESPKSDSEKAV